MMILLWLIVLLAMAWGLADFQLNQRVKPPPPPAIVRPAPPKPPPPAPELPASEAQADSPKAEAPPPPATDGEERAPRASDN